MAMSEMICQERREGCTIFGAQRVEDPYEADVNNNPGVMIVACEKCLDALAAEI